MGITIQHEKPQLEVQKTELLRKEEELKVQLAELEESLLEVSTAIQYFYTLYTQSLTTFIAIQEGLKEKQRKNTYWLNIEMYGNT